MQRLVELQYERVNIDFERGIISRARRCGRALSELSGPGISHRVLGRRDRLDLDHRSAARRGDRKTRHAHADLSEDALRDVEDRRSSVRSRRSAPSSTCTRNFVVDEGKIVEAQRLHQRTMYDLEMIKEMGFCRGIENYSRHLTGKTPGEPPPTLLDYLPQTRLMVIDESHQTVPQLRGDVQRRSVAQRDARRIRFPPAERQWTTGRLTFRSSKRASVRRSMSRQRPARMNLTKIERRSHRTDHPADRPARSGSRSSSGKGPDRSTFWKSAACVPNGTSVCWSRR